MQSPPIYAVFQGPQWTQNDSNETQIIQALKSITSGPYLSGLVQYGSDGKASYTNNYTTTESINNSTVSSTTPFSMGDLLGFVNRLISERTLPSIGATAQTPIYVVFTDGHEPTSVVNAAGFNTDSGSEHAIWVDASLSEGKLSSLDPVTRTLSHELAEAISDPAGGIQVNAGASLPTYLLPVDASGNPTRVGQIGDFEPDGYRYTWRYSSGYLVQPYWSRQDNAFIVPDSNTQDFDLDPNWNTQVSRPSFLGSYDLTVNGDQRGSNYDDTITIGLTGSGGVQVTLNGETAQFGLGAISSIDINPGGGTDRVNVESLPAHVPTFIQAGTGATTVNVAASSRNLDWLGQGSLYVYGNGNGGSTTLNIFDQANNHPSTAYTFAPGEDPDLIQDGMLTRTVTINPNSPVVQTTSMYFNGLTQLNFWAGRSPNKILVNAILPVLDAAVGDLTIDGGGGTLTIADTVSLPSSSDGSNPPDIITNADWVKYMVTGQAVGLTDHYKEIRIETGPPEGVHVPPWHKVVVTDHYTSTNIAYSNVRSLAIQGASADDTYQIQSTPSGVPVTVTAGTSGSQQFQVGNAGSVQGIHSLLTLNGPASGAATLTVDNSQSTSKDQVTITPVAVGEASTDRFFGSGGGLGYSGIGALTLDLSDAPGDAVRVTPSPATGFTLNGNAKQYQAGHGAQLALDLTGVTHASNVPQGPGFGYWTFGNRQEVAYSGMGSMGPNAAVAPVVSRGVSGLGAGGPSPSASNPRGSGSTAILPFDPSGPASGAAAVPSPARQAVPASATTAFEFGRLTPGGPVAITPGAWRRTAREGSGKESVATIG
jgi:hypothetical protein